VQTNTDEIVLNDIAERYVELVLAVGDHDPLYVDSFYGPERLKRRVAAHRKSLPDIQRDADELISRCSTSVVEVDTRDAARCRFVARQLQALRAKVRMLSGSAMSFDEESASLYDAVAPACSEQDLESVLADLDRRLPGIGSLCERYEAFRANFIVPKECLPTVFTAAVDEGKRRTERHSSLPAGETLAVEYVSNKSWAGYNWYQGGYRSLIQINVDLPIYIDRALNVASHEGYPGHHFHHISMEESLVRGRGCVEMTVNPLFSPQSFIAEGVANFGVDLAFPREQRLEFEKDVLFPAARLDSQMAGEYGDVQVLAGRLRHADAEAARRYLNGEASRSATEEWLSRFALMTPARAQQRVRFIDEFRSYVINYSVGQDVVRDYVHARAGSQIDSEQRWNVFVDLLKSQRLASDLR